MHRRASRFHQDIVGVRVMYDGPVTTENVVLNGAENDHIFTNDKALLICDVCGEHFLVTNMEQLADLWEAVHRGEHVACRQQCIPPDVSSRIAGRPEVQ